MSNSDTSFVKVEINCSDGLVLLSLTRDLKVSITFSSTTMFVRSDTGSDFFAHFNVACMRVFMFFKNKYFIDYLFLTASSLIFAGVAIRDEILAGEPALRGLVHAGIGGLFIFTIHFKGSDNPIALHFSWLGMMIAARVAWLYHSYALGALLIVGAVETHSRRTLHVSTSGVYLAIGLVSITPMMERLTEAMTFVFHVAFVSSVVDPGYAIHAIVAVIFAVRTYSSPVSIIFACACLRAILSCAIFDRGEYVETKLLPPHRQQYSQIVPSRFYTLATAIYTASLTLDAWTCCSIDSFETSTRMLHVAAVGGSLLYIIPFGCERFGWMRWALVIFPTLDAILCGYRFMTSPIPNPIVCMRGGASLIMAAALQSKSTRADVLNVETRSSATKIHRVIMLTYLIAHAWQALCATHHHTAIALLFHHAVVILSLVWMALEYEEWLSSMLSRVFLVVECVTDLTLAILSVEARVAMILNAVTSAALLWTIHSQRHRANRWYSSSLLSVDLGEN